MVIWSRSLAVIFCSKRKRKIKLIRSILLGVLDMEVFSQCRSFSIVHVYTIITLSIGTPYLLTILVFSPKIWNSSFYYLLMCLNYCCRYCKQCRPWSDAAFCGIWSGSTVFAHACMSQYLGYYDTPNILTPSLHTIHVLIFWHPHFILYMF